MDRRLKTSFWLVILPLVAIAAFLDAQAIGQLIGVSIAPSQLALEAPVAARPTPSASASTRLASAQPILDRNAFDHVSGPIKPAPDGAASASGPAESADAGDAWSAQPCEGIQVHVIMASADPAWSFAALGGADKRTLVRRGDEVSGRRVRHIGWDRVWLESSGTLCQASLFAKKAPPPPAAPAPSASARPATPGRGARPVDPTIAKGIRKVSATEFNIDRSVLDRILENQAELMRQARVVPEQQNGRVIGVKLIGLRSESLLGVLGMENGDRLQTINGFEVASPERALEAYARLRTAEKLTINLNRGGRDMNIDYNIR